MQTNSNVRKYVPSLMRFCLNILANCSSSSRSVDSSGGKSSLGPPWKNCNGILQSLTSCNQNQLTNPGLFLWFSLGGIVSCALVGVGRSPKPAPLVDDEGKGSGRGSEIGGIPTPEAGGILLPPGRSLGENGGWFACCFWICCNCAIACWSYFKKR